MLLKREKKARERDRQKQLQYLQHTERNILSRGQPQIISIFLCMIGYAMHKKNLKLMIFKS